MSMHVRESHAYREHRSLECGQGRDGGQPGCQSRQLHGGDVGITKATMMRMLVRLYDNIEVKRGREREERECERGKERE